MTDNHAIEEKFPGPEKSKKNKPCTMNKKISQLQPNLVEMQKTMGNRAVQCLLNGPKNSGAFDLDDDTADRIDRERSSGQALDTDVASKMGKLTGTNFDQVRVHTNPEADALNRQLNAKAFTTGRDIFFRQGAYEPSSIAGQKLIAHELTHVIQQSTGMVNSSGKRMTVRSPGDRFEQQANHLAETSNNPEIQPGIQRQVIDEEEA